ncbi:MAG: CLI_3235 family bacteriocin precursor [Petrimonas sp.]|jgi:putative bacteriocin precursor
MKKLIKKDRPIGNTVQAYASCVPCPSNQQSKCQSACLTVAQSTGSWTYSYEYKRDRLK